MDSEGSRSTYDSSSNSSENSQNSSASLPNEVERGTTKSSEDNLEPTMTQFVGSPGKRSISNSNEGPASRSPSKSNSDSSSSSSESENENTNDGHNEQAEDEVGSVNVVRTKSSSDVSSCDGDDNDIDNDTQKQRRSLSRNKSISPLNSRQSSRNSSSSSGRSRRNSPDQQAVDDGIKISHEDLSDVSDMECNKRITSSFNNSKQSLADDGTTSDVIATRPPAVTNDNNDDDDGDDDGDDDDDDDGDDDGDDDDEDDVEELREIKETIREDVDNDPKPVITDLRQKLDQKKNQFKSTDFGQDNVSNGESGKDKANESIEDLVKTQDEDALDFEAEEGECQDISKEDENTSKTIQDCEKGIDRTKSDGETDDGKELEEGEVSDEDEKRPEETEPKPVCRFYTRGQCTWGMSCRFLHPGVTDKGNYTMFDLVRPVSLPQSAGVGGPRPTGYNAPGDYHDYRTERSAIHHRAALHNPTPSTYGTAHQDPRALIADGPVVVESAWERGLRTAKEMMRKANKRKEQDMDFEDKKMNLTLSPDELEKDPYYMKERGTPPDAVVGFVGRHVYQDIAADMYNPPGRYGRGPPIPPYDEVDPYGRTTRYRELPPHRMPQYEDERRVRPTREVIVQRVEPAGRCDEWNDPWMRSKSPGGHGTSRERNDKRNRDRRSYSSNSSYSSSTSSQSDSSSDTSRSPSPVDHKRRYNNNSGSFKPSPPPAVRRHGVRNARSPSAPGRRPRRSTSIPASKRRHVSPSAATSKRVNYSPGHKRKKTSPNSKKSLDKTKTNRRQHTSSSSGSSDSSASDSDSDSDSGSSSSDSSSQSRECTPPKRNRGLAVDKVVKDKKVTKKVADPPKKRSPISIEIKRQATVGASALASTSPTHSISSEKDSKKSRREELLKQLRAVEDAIAKKRSKLV